MEIGTRKRLNINLINSGSELQLNLSYWYTSINQKLFYEANMSTQKGAFQFKRTCFKQAFASVSSFSSLCVLAYDFHLGPG